MSVNIRELQDPVTHDVFYPLTDIHALKNNGQNAIDDVPTDSDNLISSKGVFKHGSGLDVSVLNADTSTTPATIAKYANLSAALAAIPVAYRTGGMTIRFVLSSDNKYVQYRYMLNYAGNTTAENNKFINPANWQGVDDEVVAGSKNLVESAGVQKLYENLSEKIINTLGFGDFSFQISPSSHSSNNDRLSVDIKAGSNIRVDFDVCSGAAIVDASNVTLFLFFAEGTPVPAVSYSAVWPNKTISCTALNDVVAIGFYMQVASAGTFKYSLTNDNPLINRIGDAIVATNVDLNTLSNNKDAFCVVLPSTLGLPNISTANQNVVFRNETVLVFNKKYYSITPQTTVALNGFASGAKAIIFDTSNNTLSCIPINTALTNTQVIVMLIRTNYGSPFTTVYSYACTCECTIDGNHAYATKNEFSTFVEGYASDLADIQDEFADIKKDVYGEYNYSFSSNAGAHSSADDKYAIDYKANRIIKGTLSLGTAGFTLQGGLIAYLYDSNDNVVVQKNITMGEEFTLTAANDASYISFYISRVTKASTFNVELNYAGIQNNVVAINDEISDINDEIDEINEKLNTIPSYFDENIESVITNARKDASEIGLDGETFVFITDMHWENNEKHSPAIIKKICDELIISNVVFGGDAINGQADQNNALKFFSEISSGLKAADSNFVSVFGNHDLNSADGGTVFSSEKPFYSVMQKSIDYIAHHGGATYFYFDNPSTNTRYIILDSFIGNDIANSQETWFEQVLSDTDNNVNIIVFVHAYLEGTPVYNEGTYIGYNIGKSSAGTKINTVLDNAQQQGKKIQCVISGHNHLDYNGMTDTMIPVIVSDCDTKQSLQWPNTTGTKNEQSFDVVTIDYTNKIIICRRIGRGKSRIIHYDKKTLAIGNTLDISSLLEIVPTSYSIRDNNILQYRNAAGGGTGVTFSSTLATISSSGVVTAVASGLLTAVAENDDCIETFNIKIN